MYKYHIQILCISPLSKMASSIFFLSAHNGRDRFVVPRASLSEKGRRVAWNARGFKDDAEIWSSKYLQQKKYINFLDEAFSLAPMNTRQTRNVREWSWPCVPRKKSYLSSADSILDLPAYSFAVFPQLLDWSNDDILVAALGTNYHKWSWQTQNTISQGFTYYTVQCCKFDPTGELLLLGTFAKRVEVHNNERGKCQFVLHCKCYIPYCSITAIDWSPTGNSFVTGCSHGTICAMSRKEYVIRSQSVFKGATMMVRISPNARFVATAGFEGDAAVVLSWPELTMYSFLPTHETIKDLDWHPWRSALLGIGIAEGDHSCVSVWEPSSYKNRVERIGRGSYSLDAMLFNHRTGELVLSLWNLDVNQTANCSQLVVMSDFDTVVDHWGEGRSGLDRVRTMVFSPDGTKLATATEDEDLIIWNFLPKDYNKMKTCKKFSAFPQFLDKVSYGFTLR